MTSDDDVDGVGYDFGDRTSVPAGEGTSPTEATIYNGETRAKEDLSCPNGCVDLEVTAHREAGAVSELIDQAVQDEPGPCPACGAPLGGETDG